MASSICSCMLMLYETTLSIYTLWVNCCPLPGCGWEDGAADYHPPLPRQHLQLIVVLFQVVAGRMGLLITILLCLVNIFNSANETSPSVKVYAQYTQIFMIITNNN